MTLEQAIAQALAETKERQRRRGVTAMAHCIFALGHDLGASPEKIVDLLTGFCFTDKEAQELKADFNTFPSLY